jgi:hypothetical protein
MDVMFGVLKVILKSGKVKYNIGKNRNRGKVGYYWSRFLENLVGGDSWQKANY